MSMTKTDYELIARPFRQMMREYSEDNDTFIITKLASLLSDELTSENNRFDRNKFLIACGIETKCLYLECNNTANTSRGVCISCNDKDRARALSRD
jgi:hypothetical protein